MRASGFLFFLLLLLLGSLSEWASDGGRFGLKKNDNPRFKMSMSSFSLRGDIKREAFLVETEYWIK